MDNKEKLLAIFQNDPLNLLEVKPQASPVKSEDERLVASFHEINDFYEKHGRKPEKSMDMQERTLYSRLKGINENDEKRAILSTHDIHNLLDAPVENEVHTIDDIFASDELGIFDSNAEDIFTLTHVPKETTMPDYVARRKPCKDFEKYEQRLIDCQADLKEGKRKLYPFKDEQQIHQGYFFVLKGVLLYVAEVGKREKSKGKTNARLRCIFENGTESDMLLRSLAAELYKDGRRVSEYEDRLYDQFTNVTDEDDVTGFIYVLKSQSNDPKIKEMENLYKIGFSRVPVRERIKNAENETTYLMAPVEIISEYQCFNMNPHKFEQLLHAFFSKVCLNVDVYDNKGHRHTPREWFQVPYTVIDEVINYILSGEIVDYRYDYERERIVAR